MDTSKWQQRPMDTAPRDGTLVKLLDDFGWLQTSFMWREDSKDGNWQTIDGHPLRASTAMIGWHPCPDENGGFPWETAPRDGTPIEVIDEVNGIWHGPYCYYLDVPKEYQNQENISWRYPELPAEEPVPEPQPAPSELQATEARLLQLGRIDGRLEMLARRLEDHEARLRSLEESRIVAESAAEQQTPAEPTPETTDPRNPSCSRCRLLLVEVAASKAECEMWCRRASWLCKHGWDSYEHDWYIRAHECGTGILPDWETIDETIAEKDGE